MKLIYCIAAASLILASCDSPKKVEPAGTEPQKSSETRIVGDDGKLYQSEQFADLRVLHYYIPGWEKLSARQKTFVYYLYEAGLAGRDIMWDQNCKFNIPIRTALEKIYTEYKGDKTTENWKSLELYL